MLFKYLFVGGINTVFTAVVIFTLMYFSTNLYLANLIGYSLGIILSFILNSYFTFERQLQFQRLIKFLIACLLSYITNLFILRCYLLLDDNAYIAQIIAMCGYTFVGFFLNKCWVMK